MRFDLPATAVGLCCLLPLGAGWTAPPAVATQTAAAAPSAPEGSSAGEAARHAKRTACIKEAKAKKLVGTTRNTYIKNCIAAR